MGLRYHRLNNTHTNTQVFNNEKGSLPNEMLDQNITVLSYCYYFFTTQKPRAHILVTPHLSPVTHKEYSICQVSYQRIFEDPHSKPTGSIAWRNRHCQRHAVTSLSVLLQFGLPLSHLSAPKVLYCLQQRLSHPEAKGRNCLITVCDRAYICFENAI